jgi:xanthine dehydrogenase accessory factor
VSDLLILAAALRERDEPFVLATVVRCERPTSAKPGAKALIRADGAITGWVGGACAEPVVVREALAALRDGQPRLVSLVGESGRVVGRVEGIRELPMTCHSGGTLEIYVEPYLPKPVLLLIGHGPLVETLAALGRAVDYAVTVVDADPHALDGVVVTPRTAVVVATHGEVDEGMLERVLDTSAGYVSLVASRKRAAAIAVSILAEIIQLQRGEKAPAGESPTAEAAEARDPVCGMTVVVATARYRSDAPGGPVYFCAAGCKARFDAAPEQFAGTRVTFARVPTPPTDPRVR